jgi:hypothetical protein
MDRSLPPTPLLKADIHPVHRVSARSSLSSCNLTEGAQMSFSRTRMTLRPPCCVWLDIIVLWKYTNRRAEASEKQPGTDMDAASQAASNSTSYTQASQAHPTSPLTRHGRTCRYQRHLRRLESTSAEFIVRMFLPCFPGAVLFSDRTQQLKYACFA